MQHWAGLGFFGFCPVSRCRFFSTNPSVVKKKGFLLQKLMPLGTNLVATWRRGVLSFILATCLISESLALHIPRESTARQLLHSLRRPASSSAMSSQAPMRGGSDGAATTNIVQNAQQAASQSSEFTARECAACDANKQDSF
jgi:hypothetical protein